MSTILIRTEISLRHRHLDDSLDNRLSTIKVAPHDPCPLVKVWKGESEMTIKVLVPFLGASLIFHQQQHLAHTLFAGPPLMVSWSAQAMSVTATASTAR